MPTVREHFAPRGFCPSAADWIQLNGRGEVRPVIPVDMVSCPLPLWGGGSKLDKLSRYTAPAAHVAILPWAFSVGDEGAVVTEDGELVLSSIQRLAVSALGHPVWQHRECLEHQIEFDGILGVVTHHGTRNFAHVLADGIPRAWLIRRAGFEPDAWLVPAAPPAWISELFDHVGIPASRRVEVRPETVIKARWLAVPNGTGFAYGIAPWARKALLEAFKDVAPSLDGHARLWVSRQRASRRQWLQEAEARDAIEGRGFQIYHLEDLCVANQARLAVNAEVVAGTHGAGLTWALASHCTAGLLFEVAGHGLVHNSYRSVSAVSGWQYARTTGANAPVAGGDNYLTDVDLPINLVLTALDHALERWEAQR